jgi:hypothetical protein
MSTITHSGSNASVDCPPEARVTRALLGYGMLVGPVYLVASVTEGVIRPSPATAGACWPTAAPVGSTWSCSC